MFGLANILDYKNPLTGQKSNLLDLKDWSQLILGVFVVLIAYAGGSYLVGLVKAKAPKVTATAADSSSGWVVAGGGN